MSLDLHLVLDDDQLGKIAKRVAEILRAEQLLEADAGFVNIDGAAAFLGISPQRVRKLVAQRTIPFCQEARNCRITFGLRDLSAWMETQRHAPRGGDA